MALYCPSCQKPVSLPAIPLKEGVDIFCVACNAKLHLQLSLLLLDSEKAQPAPSVPAADKVMVGVEGEVTREMITEVLTGGGYSVLTATDGHQALKLMLEEKPIVSVLDVGLPYVFETVIMDAEKYKGLEGLKIILLSSIHNQARYKREPVSLYGADDYIERHHIEDGLLNKIHKLTGIQEAVAPAAPQPAAQTVAPETPKEPQRKPEPAPEAPLPPPQAAPVTPPKPAPVTPLKPAPEPAAEIKPRESPKPPVSGDLAEHDAAKRLARLIILDIALYNQKRVEEGVRNGTFKEVLSDELTEGLNLYQARTPEAVAKSSNYFEEAIQDFVEKQKAKMGQ
jgi:CheY-like chemotaxis protein